MRIVQSKFAIHRGKQICSRFKEYRKKAGKGIETRRKVRILGPSMNGISHLLKEEPSSEDSKISLSICFGGLA